MASLLARTVRPGIAVGLLSVCGSLLSQAATAASACAPSAMAKTSVVSVMNDMVRITDAEVHVACNLAWITYVNQGSVEDASGRQAVTWLESAILEYSDARWRIRFLHSTRASKAT
jgi:hypothetical protein